MFRNLTCLGIKHIKKSVTTKRLEKCLCSKHIFYSVDIVLDRLILGERIGELKN